MLDYSQVPLHWLDYEKPDAAQSSSGQFVCCVSYEPVCTKLSLGTAMFQFTHFKSRVIKLSKRALSGAQSLNLSKDSVVVISTCSRGIGLEFAKQILNATPATVIGLARSVDNNSSLDALKHLHEDRLQLLRVDLTDQSAIENVTLQIKQSYSRIDLLLNVAGILGDGGKTAPGPERTVLGMDRNWLTKSFEVHILFCF